MLWVEHEISEHAGGVLSVSQAAEQLRRSSAVHSRRISLGLHWRELQGCVDQPREQLEVTWGSRVALRRWGLQSSLDTHASNRWLTSKSFGIADL